MDGNYDSAAKYIIIAASDDKPGIHTILLDNGVITEEEFAAKKKQLMNI